MWSEMAGASDPLEDMLFSEVDEKDVSDLVGSLESQLAGQSNPAGKTDENGGAGSVAPANHHLGKTLPAPVGTTTVEQQQGRRNKPEMRQELNCNDASPDKTVTSLAAGGAPPLGDPSATSAACGNATSGGSQSHGASITTPPASGASTLASPSASISTASGRGSKAAPPGVGETSTEARKRVAAPRRSASARIKSFNGAAVTTTTTTTRRNSNTAVVDAASTADASATTANSSAPLTSPINTSTFTVSNANLPVGQLAIALDRGTPTIALHRLPSHIVASIAQNGNGTSVSALVQQGARIGAVTSTAAQENHSTTVTDSGASKTDDCQSKIVMSGQSGSVNSALNTVSSAPCVVTPTTTTAASTTTTTVTQPLSSATAAACVTGAPAQTTSVTTTVSMIRPTVPSPTTAVVASPQCQPRPGLTSPQRIVAPQLIVRPPQQQTTIQLPPGFTIPPGKVCRRRWREGRRCSYSNQM